MEAKGALGKASAWAGILSCLLAFGLWWNGQESKTEVIREVLVPAKETDQYRQPDPVSTPGREPAEERAALIAAIRVEEAAFFPWKNPTMMNNGNDKSYSSAFCVENRHMGCKLSFVVPAARSGFKFDYNLLLKRQGGELLEEIMASTAVPRCTSVSTITTFPSQVFHLASIEPTGGEELQLVVEVRLEDRLLSYQNLTLRQCEARSSPPPKEIVREQSVQQQATRPELGAAGTVPMITTPVEDCISKRTGSYCFTNNSSGEIRVGGPRRCSPPCPLIIGPGRTECFRDLPVGSYPYSITGYSRGGNRIVASGSIQIQQCESGSYSYP